MIKNSVSKDIIDAIYYSLIESNFFKNNLEKDFDDTIWNKINESLSCLYYDNDDFIMRLIENIYIEYLTHRYTL
jgi:hypothetical protein